MDVYVATVILLAALLAAAAGLAAVLPGRVAVRLGAALGPRLDAIDRELVRLDRTARGDAAQGRAEAARAAHEQRTELAQALTLLGESSERRLAAIRDAVEGRLEQLRKDSAARLDQMRATVDERLQGTLEARLGESFRLVSERLEAVQRGLGEMQSLATGVGDLKKVLANVKIRGTWGEVQLGALLAQLLSPAQYASNVQTREGSAERVEFAVRLPGDGEGAREVLLPIDAKFPQEDYLRLVDASERGDAAEVEANGKLLEARVRACARDVRDKYVNPPRTTDFAILFLPTEGLYAEVVRRAGLVEALQRELKISVAGPSTLTALLNSLQMGFRTLAIQRRSSEVWQVLGAVKAEWGRFGDVLQRVERKLGEASRTLQEVETRRRAIDRRLRDVQELPAGAAPLLPDPPVSLQPVPEQPVPEDAESGTG